MRRRHQFGLVALGGVALVAAFVWFGGEDRASRARQGESIAAAESAADSELGSAYGRSQRRDRAGADGDSESVDDSNPDFDAVFDAAGETVSVEPEAEASDRRLGDDPTPIALDPLRGVRWEPTVSLAGFDPLGPRDLLAWRLANGRFAIIARGRSDRDGTLSFPALVAARDGLEIVVTAADSAPGLPGASEPRRWSARDPLAPQARLLTTDAAGHHLRIAPREGSGEVVLADGYGVVLARYPVSESPIEATRVFDVALTSSTAEVQLFLAHEFADGRASEWEVLTLPAVEPDDDGFE